MPKSFRERRFEKPLYEITAHITGVKHGDTGLIDWHVHVEGDDVDAESAAGMLERAAEVLRDETIEEPSPGGK